MKTQNTVEAENLLHMVNGDRELLGELCSVFESESAHTLSELSAASARQDLARVRDAAHRLRGSLGSMCAPSASAVARTLEQKSMEDASLVIDLVAQLHEAVAAVVSSLRDLRGRAS
jgi:HPt (histidine-containing phosphotransfer) domain-containing protein